MNGEIMLATHSFLVMEAMKLMVIIGSYHMWQSLRIGSDEALMLCFDYFESKTITLKIPILSSAKLDLPG